MLRKLFRNLLVVMLMLVIAPTSTLAEELRIDIPSARISVNTETIGVISGQLGVPENPDNAGLFQEPGNLIIVGHVDMGGEIRPFYNLKNVQENDEVYFSDGRSFHVVWTSIPGIDEDMSDAFAPSSGPNEITLVTCSGPFSISRHYYLNRLVIRAVQD